MGFANRLKQRREELGFTQKYLGELVGVSGNSIGNYENGVSTPNTPTLYRLFSALQCDANYLYQDEMADVIMKCGSYTEKYRQALSTIISEADGDAVDYSIEIGALNMPLIRSIIDGGAIPTFEQACTIAEEVGESLDRMIGWTTVGDDEISRLFASLPNAKKASLLDYAKFLSQDHTEE